MKLETANDLSDDEGGAVVVYAPPILVLGHRKDTCFYPSLVAEESVLITFENIVATASAAGEEIVSGPEADMLVALVERHVGLATDH